VEKMVFDDDNNIAGFTRQTTNNNTQLVANDAYKPTFSYQQGDISFNLINTLDNGCGFALVKAANPAYAGIFSYYWPVNPKSQTDPEITLSTSNGTINKVTILVAGKGQSTSMTMDGKEVEGESTSTSGVNSWTWSAEEGLPSLVITWTGTSSYYIHSVEVNYTPDLGGKEDCGLSFSEESAQVIIGQSFTAPTLSNPNDLAITWTSSDENVATVNENGEISLVAGGKTIIQANTEGNDSFAKGYARYELTVVPSASNCLQLAEYAPNEGDLIYVNFPMIVTYASGSNAFVKDSEGNASYIHNTKNDGATGATDAIYKVGDIIPAGWMATNQGVSGYYGNPADVTETTEVVYPTVTSISYENDANKVLILKNVTFTKSTPVGDDKVNATTPDGTEYAFANTFNSPIMPAGTYDVTVVVKSDVRGTTHYNWLAPIAYAQEEILPDFPEIFGVKVNGSFDPMNVKQDLDEDGAYIISVSGLSENEDVKVEIEVPEGWDGFYGISMADFGGADTDSVKVKALAEGDEEEEPRAWVAEDIFTANPMFSNMTKDKNSFEFKADGNEEAAMLFLYKDDKVYVGVQILLEENVGKMPVVPETIVIATDSEDVTVTEGIDEDFSCALYTVAGKTENNTINIEFEVPEGWDGFVGGFMDMSETSARKARDINPIEWVPLENFTLEGMETGNKFELPVGHNNIGQFMLYKGNQADPANMFMVAVIVEKAEVEPAPEFPESFDVKLSNNCEALKLTQGEEQGVYTISITGECDEEEVTVTIATPEGWTGLIGITDGEYVPDVNNEPLKTRAMEDDEEEWMPLDMMKELMEGMKEGNSFKFPVDGDEHQGQFFLYKDNMAYMTQIALNFEVAYNVEAGINAIEAANSVARYFNLQGVEVKNPENGVYVKVANGKASKVTVK
ncbi:MAG: Ig-like domain-containing protein, partial [Muribaculaceae bacterium]|nr:Ig-like domain-containing protein [Muribaculaceae bacterium]